MIYSKNPQTKQVLEHAALHSGQTPKSLRAWRTSKQICEKHLAGKYHIEIIDLLENPQLASTDRSSHPTLIRKLPEPMRKSSVICRTSSVCWLALTCVWARKGSYVEPSQHPQQRTL